MASQVQARWLLIGNTRWHWAANQGAGWVSWHTPPLGQSLEQAHPAAPEGAAALPLAGWAAVGPVPELPALDPAQRIGLDQVPLQVLPPWLGIDRALGGWRAWQIAQAPVLVADAGTALSLTRVDGQGCFAGGRLLAGAGLQLQALGQGTAQLPTLSPILSGAGAADLPCVQDPWPQATGAAMQSGVAWGLAAAMAAAAQQVWQSEPACQLFLTGGDGAPLAPLVEALLGPALAGRVTVAPDLALEALALLGPLRPNQDR